MNTEKNLIKFIEKLDNENQNLNLFFENENEELILGNTTINYLIKNNDEIYNFLHNLDKNRIDHLIEKLSFYSCEELLKTLTKINQYIEIGEKLRHELFSLYIEFNTKLITTIYNDSLTIEWLYQAVHDHQFNMKLILKNVDELTVFINKTRYIEHVPNFEYTPDIQIKLMKIDLEKIIEPVLDIGCGEHANLVQYLKNNGINVIGIDRNVKNSSNTIKTSWFDYDFESNKFGTIISHQSFANHFRRQHYKQNGKIIEYSKLYLKILNSLKQNGCFFYTPDLPFIECFLNPEHYVVIKNQIENYHFNSICVTKL